MLFLVFAFPVLESKAQEVLTNLNENIQTSPATKLPKTKSISSIELPFVDDFSKSGQVTPNPKLWRESQSVYINRTFAINPPTVGVATFDPFDSRGKIYDRAVSSVFAADTLTSEFIQLSYSPVDSICLSFYFQPKGYGDMPESSDSLTLEFYSPLDDVWNNVWSASVVSVSKIEVSNHLANSKTVIEDDSIGFKFFRSNIKIENSKYLNNSFSFRFINYASINIHPGFPGRSTASDHWHLDFVYLDRNRAANNPDIPDISLIGDPKRLTTDYETVPATHFEFAKAELFEDPMNLELNYTNFGWGTKSVTRNFRLRSIYGASGRTLSYSAGAENIPDGSTINLSYAIPRYDFSITGDSASFEMLSWIDTDNDPSNFRTALRYNDTSRIIYEFKDCYAYDDGTAENGYGLFGNGSSQGKVAVKFRTYMADSLRGVYMYFNRAVNDINENYDFIIAVWNDAGGIPGELIHSETGGRPVFRDSLNKYIAYKFSKPVHLLEGETFYVGWLQTDEVFLNIGFDRNRSSRNSTFYSLGQIWEPSVFDGSLMIRPIFCRSDLRFPSDYVELEYNDNDNRNIHTFRAYPNPARGIVYLEEDDSAPLKSSKIELYALSGELVKVFENVLGNIDVTNIMPGIYFMRVWNVDRKIREVKKIIVSGQ
ncbi:MAG: T9SS type A sorting domain-containing protein [Prevotellaceae bacterium]|nr:T9SS type A sorting domain-containing protein [Prevotellaceae bacterium]